MLASLSAAAPSRCSHRAPARSCCDRGGGISESKIADGRRSQAAGAQPGKRVSENIAKGTAPLNQPDPEGQTWLECPHGAVIVGSDPVQAPHPAGFPAHVQCHRPECVHNAIEFRDELLNRRPGLTYQSELHS